MFIPILCKSPTSIPKSIALLACLYDNSFIAPLCLNFILCTILFDIRPHLDHEVPDVLARLSDSKVLPARFVGLPFSSFAQVRAHRHDAYGGLGI